MAEADNLYELLELDPSDVSWEAVERRLAEKREEWSRDLNQGSPRRRQQAAALLERLKEATEVLRDPAVRKRQAAELLQRREAAREEVRRRLEGRVRLLAGGGTCSRAQWARLVEEFGEHFSPEEIEGMLRQAGVDPPGPSVRPPELRLDPAEARKIRDRLDLLGHQDLYDFLGLGPEAPPEGLRGAADDVLRQQGKAARADARTTARRDLAVLCSRLFADPEGKDRYERQRLFERLSPLDPSIELAGSGGRLTAAQVAALVEEAKAAGVEPDAARAYVLEVAEEKGWPVEVASPGAGAPEAATPRPSVGGGGDGGREGAPAPASEEPADPVRPRDDRSGPAATGGGTAGASPSPGSEPGSTGGAHSGTTPGVALARWRRTFAVASVLVALSAGVFVASQTPVLSMVASLLTEPTPDPLTTSGGGSGPTPPLTPKVVGPGKVTNPPTPPVVPTPTPVPAPPPSRRVVVLVDGQDGAVGLGDAVVAGLLDELHRLDVDGQGTGGSLSLEPPLPPLPQLLPTLQQEGFGFVVRVIPTIQSEREIRAFGRSEVAYQARVSVNVFRVPGGRGVGRGWNETVEYSTSDLDRAAREITDRIGAEVAVAILDAP